MADNSFSNQLLFTFVESLNLTYLSIFFTHEHQQFAVLYIRQPYATVVLVYLDGSCYLTAFIFAVYFFYYLGW